MKLSTKGRYGLRAMIDLAIHSKENQVSIKSISERQEISENYLERIIALLKKAGYVKSTRGAQGGYMLTKKPDQISVGNILRALEGDLNPVDCSLINDDKVCSESSLCVTKFVWKRISDSINDVVDNISLQDLVNEQLEIDKSQLSR
ncbi:transcriptional regulator of cysteine biosynthesis [Petrocella atlantisensis]|uniref:Transcriptional regulator of cysteine biosynthesis n=1 Tax=Petrocella atlantisensis TaxID=2173034 RepID=A0A3P7S2H9_9FIRM|nr:Rrf2 family transcriptional regulator [Petrocella atlantisensis]MCF8018862.1 Rrf2 family transcriptional regulator [Vallitaleaceae bacterium]PKM53480.1 MAG: Rrf2 family transcriptional regulator [Firmicutes bacterium HGW-Firmicutes-5]VDN49046.1 transcriptional regulator of cysteine biosynthesis [Petrocella atlantisensis]